MLESATRYGMVTAAAIGNGFVTDKDLLVVRIEFLDHAFDRGFPHIRCLSAGEGNQPGGFCTEQDLPQQNRLQYADE